MNCKDVQELLSAYHDGELAGAEEPLIARHLEECPACTRRLAGFENLSAIAGQLTTPAPPEHVWRRLERELSPQLAEAPSATGHRSLSWRRSLSLAAAVLIAVGLGWFANGIWNGRGGAYHQAAVASEFGKYLAEFRTNPAAAQKLLLTKYDGREVAAERIVDELGYEPAAARGLPEGYTVETSYVVKMPCCTCAQTLCRRADGSTLAIFEHDDSDGKEWFGNRPTITTQCHGKQCCLVEVDDRIAANWDRGRRHITLVGVKDVDEVDRLVAWLDDHRDGIE